MKMAYHYLFVSTHFLTNKNQLSSYTQVNFMVREVFFFFSCVILLGCRDYRWCGRAIISKNSTAMHVTHGYYSDPFQSLQILIIFDPLCLPLIFSVFLLQQTIISSFHRLLCNFFITRKVLQHIRGVFSFVFILGPLPQGVNPLHPQISILTERVILLYIKPLSDIFMKQAH